MTEEELIEVHQIKKTELDWRTTLATLCQKRVPKNTVLWEQFKATVEMKRNKRIDDPLSMEYPKELRSCRDGSSSYISPQKLGESVTYDDDAPTPPGLGSDAMGEPVPKACTFCFRSFLFQILTRFSYKPAARNESKGVLTLALLRDQILVRLFSSLSLLNLTSFLLLAGGKRRVNSRHVKGPATVDGDSERMIKSARISAIQRTPHHVKAKEPMVQAAGYAAEVMSEQVMTHTYGCVIEG